jgi:hypothetical protein
VGLHLVVVARGEERVGQSPGRRGVELDCDALARTHTSMHSA